MSSFSLFIENELTNLKKDGLFRDIDIIDSGCYTEIVINNQSLINFCSNNYLSLNGNPLIANAMKTAIDKWGTSSGASRLIVGNIGIFEEAEEVLARFKNKESALIFSSGYQANVTVISTLMGDGDEIFSDYLNHASIIDGCRMCKAKISIYKHRDMNHLEGLLKKSACKKKLIVTDGVFSMDGDVAPLQDIYELANRYDAFVIVDDAHATGILGHDGSGTCAHFGINSDKIMVLGTGGKALGVGGAFFCCPKYVRDYLINKGRGFIYSTAPVPAIPAGLIAAVEVIKKEPERREKLLELSRYFHSKLVSIGYKTGEKPSHILPLIVGENDRALKIADYLRKSGIYAKAIRTPTVPKGSERIRFSLTAQHTKDDIDKVIQALSYLSKYDQ